MQLLGFCVWPSVLHHRCSALSNLKVNSNSLLHIPSPPAAFAEPKNDMICHLQLTSDSESEDKFCPHNSINTTTPQNHKGAWSFCSSKTERPQLYTEMEGLWLVIFCWFKHDILWIKIPPLACWITKLFLGLYAGTLDQIHVSVCKFI